MARLLRETPASTLAQLAGVSKQYVSQVKQGQRSPSERLIQALLQLLHKPSFPNKAPTDTSVEKTLSLFLQSRQGGISPETIRVYCLILGKALKVLGLAPSIPDINIYLCSKGDCG